MGDKWTTSGRSRLKAKQQSTFAARAHNRTAMAITGIAAPAYSTETSNTTYCHPRLRRRSIGGGSYSTYSDPIARRGISVSMAPPPGTYDPKHPAVVLQSIQNNRRIRDATRQHMNGPQQQVITPLTNQMYHRYQPLQYSLHNPVPHPNTQYSSIPVDGACLTYSSARNPFAQFRQDNQPRIMPPNDSFNIIGRNSPNQLFSTVYTNNVSPNVNQAMQWGPEYSLQGEDLFSIKQGNIQNYINPPPFVQQSLTGNNFYSGTDYFNPTSHTRRDHLFSMSSPSQNNLPKENIYDRSFNEPLFPHKHLSPAMGPSRSFEKAWGAMQMSHSQRQSQRFHTFEDTLGERYQNDLSHSVPDDLSRTQRNYGIERFQRREMEYGSTNAESKIEQFMNTSRSIYQQNSPNHHITSDWKYDRNTSNDYRTQNKERESPPIPRQIGASTSPYSARPRDVSLPSSTLEDLQQEYSSSSIRGHDFEDLNDFDVYNDVSEFKAEAKEGIPRFLFQGKTNTKEVLDKLNSHPEFPSGNTGNISFDYIPSSTQKNSNDEYSKTEHLYVEKSDERNKKRHANEEIFYIPNEKSESGNEPLTFATWRRPVSRATMIRSEDCHSVPMEKGNTPFSATTKDFKPDTESTATPGIMINKVVHKEQKAPSPIRFFNEGIEVSIDNMPITLHSQKRFEALDETCTKDTLHGKDHNKPSSSQGMGRDSDDDLDLKGMRSIWGN